MPVFQRTNPRSATITIAASDARVKSKKGADYVCDGVNDHVQIQAAIDSLGTGESGIVHLTDGNFYIGDTITLKSKITLEGEGRDVTAIILANSKNVTMLYTADAVSRYIYIVIKDLALDGNRSNNTSGSGIHLNSCWKARLERLYIKQTAQYGIKLDGPTTSTLETYIEDIFTNNTTDAGFYQTWTYDTTGIQIYHDNNDAGPAIHLVSGGSTFYHIHSTNAQEEAILVAGADVVLYNCMADTALLDGIKVTGNRNILIGCDAFNSSGYIADVNSGLVVSGQNNIVIGGHFRDNRAIAQKRQRYGIEEKTGADYNLYAFNNLIGNLTGPISLLGQHSKAYSNPGDTTYNFEKYVLCANDQTISNNNELVWLT